MIVDFYKHDGGISMSITFEEIHDAFETMSLAPVGVVEVFYHISTGKVYYDFTSADNPEPLPDDIDDTELYLRFPDSNELPHGRSLALGFAEEHLSDDDYDRVCSYFNRRGAFARFKDLLEDRGIIDAWYKYQADTIKQAAREWCKENSINVVEENSTGSL